MSAIAFVAGVALSWPGFLMIASYLYGDLERSRLPVAILITASAVGLFAIGSNGLLKGNSAPWADVQTCGAGLTSYEC